MYKSNQRQQKHRIGESITAPQRGAHPQSSPFLGERRILGPGGGEGGREGGEKGGRREIVRRQLKQGIYGNAEGRSKPKR